MGDGCRDGRIVCVALGAFQHTPTTDTVSALTVVVHSSYSQCPDILSFAMA